MFIAVAITNTRHVAPCTENDERLRETLGVFLRTGSSFKANAEELHPHDE